MRYKPVGAYWYNDVCMAMLVVLMFLAGCVPPSPRERDSAAEKEAAQKRIEIVSRAVSDLIETSKLQPEVKAEMQASANISAQLMSSVIADARPVPVNAAPELDIRSSPWFWWSLYAWLGGIGIGWAIVAYAWWNDIWRPKLRSRGEIGIYTESAAQVVIWPFYALFLAIMGPCYLIDTMREKNLARLERKRMAEEVPIEIVYNELNELFKKEGIDD